MAGSRGVCEEGTDAVCPHSRNAVDALRRPQYPQRNIRNATSATQYPQRNIRNAISATHGHCCAALACETESGRGASVYSAHALWHAGRARPGRRAMLHALRQRRHGSRCQRCRDRNTDIAFRCCTDCNADMAAPRCYCTNRTRCWGSGILAQLGSYAAVSLTSAPANLCVADNPAF